MQSLYICITLQGHIVLTTSQRDEVYHTQCFLHAAFCFLYKVFNNRPLTQKRVYVWPISEILQKKKTCGKDKWPNQKAIVVRHMAFENVLQGEFRRDCDWIVLDDSWHFNGVVQSHGAIFYAYSAYVHRHTHAHLMLRAFIYTKQMPHTSSENVFNSFF